MIVKMKFLSITGPRADIDRISLIIDHAVTCSNTRNYEYSVLRCRMNVSRRFSYKIEGFYRLMILYAW